MPLPFPVERPGRLRAAERRRFRALLRSLTPLLSLPLPSHRSPPLPGLSPCPVPPPPPSPMRMEARGAARARPGPAFKGFGAESKVRRGAGTLLLRGQSCPGSFPHGITQDLGGKPVSGIFGTIPPCRGAPGTLPSAVSLGKLSLKTPKVKCQTHFEFSRFLTWEFRLEFAGNGEPECGIHPGPGAAGRASEIWIFPPVFGFFLLHKFSP